MPGKNYRTKISDMVRIVVAPATELGRVCRQPLKISRQNSRSLSNGLRLSDIARDNAAVGLLGMHHVNYPVINPRCRFMIADNLLGFLTHQCFHSGTSSENLA